ncbi:MAG: murein biosynthesis integral membrane protein MurJ [Bradyrhizobium sp.]|nr:MAG: murein biosynthesis integral membrane protein MurJ [Bradyrhizobium sp.]
MYRNFLSVGGFTAMSRLTGFARDLMIGAVMGVGPLADAFVVALRLPNQFRAIFGEGAFNSAYVPTYSRVLAARGDEAAATLASRIFTLLLISQLALLAAAFFYTPQLVGLIAPGFSDHPEKFALAVTMTRITFPYLAFVTLATLHSGTLNANGYFSVAAFAPVLLNVFVVGFLALASLFPNAGEAACWGVLASGLAQLVLLMAEARRRGVLERLAIPRLDADVKQFFAALGPAVIGSAGQQIAILADTILASLLPHDANSSMYYAERLYQLPLGVIGVAAGTVLLPEMSRRLANGDQRGAAAAQNRSIALTFALAAPFLVAFLVLPDETMRGAFLRGAFTAEAARGSALVLAAYGLGLAPMVLIRSAIASFQSRGDTTTPMLCFFAGLAVNLALKLTLYRDLGPAGLALGTAAGAWINFALLLGVGKRWGWFAPDRRLIENVAVALIGVGAAAIAAPWLFSWVDEYVRDLAMLRGELDIVAAGLLTLVVYGAVSALALLALGRSPRRQPL